MEEPTAVNLAVMGAQLAGGQTLIDPLPEPGNAAQVELAFAAVVGGSGGGRGDGGGRQEGQQGEGVNVG